MTQGATPSSMGTRWDQLARKVVTHSLELTRGQKVYIDHIGSSDIYVEALVKHILQVGGWPYVRNLSIRQLKWLIKEGTEEQIRNWCQKELETLADCDAYISLRAEENSYELYDLPAHQYELYKSCFLLPLQARIASLKRWTVLKTPSIGLAQLARMSLDQFSHVYYRACTMDYDKLARRARPLQQRLDACDQVRIRANGTDVKFSVDRIPSYLCDGRFNLPDGELFTAPVVDSVEGYMTFNVPTSFLGQYFEAGQRIVFRNGKITDINGSEQERIWRILQQDQGASRVGEFGIGLNPHIRQPMHNLLFDEKMLGSIHLALGQAFPMADNGNESAIHWDFVLDMRSAGGGELFFDDVLIQKDGRFVPDDLSPLHGEGETGRRYC